jgi:excinuclease UvrABC nuclease subunit
MKSGDLAGRGFNTWRPFAIEAERELLDHLPTCHGVYLMRFTRIEPRLRGESDIAYIGRATNQNGLRGRVRQYFHPGWRQSTNLEMKARLVQRVPLELGHVLTGNAEEAIDLKSALLLAFEAEHGERPPFNKQTALAHLVKKAT